MVDQNLEGARACCAPHVHAPLDGGHRVTYMQWRRQGGGEGQGKNAPPPLWFCDYFFACQLSDFFFFFFFFFFKSKKKSVGTPPPPPPPSPNPR